MKENLTNKDYWNPDLYDQSHSFISNYGRDLIELLAPKQDEKILDLGCGTGDLTNTLDYMGVNVLGVDNSKNMIEEARSKYPHINFIVKDATNLGYNSDFDAVFSNATLHWVKKPKQALACIYQSLNTGGRYIAEFGGKGNVQIITSEIIYQLKKLGFEYKMEQFPWYYPSIGEYTSLMEEVGFRVVFAQHFDRPTHLEGDNGLKKWIEMFGIHMLQGIDKDIEKYIIERVERNLKNSLYQDGKWIADYKRIRVIGIKE